VFSSSSRNIRFNVIFAGVPAINYYTVDIFASASSAMDPNMATISAGMAEIAGGAVALVLTDIVGRRILLVVSSLIMGSSMAILSCMFQLSADRTSTPSLLESVLTVGSVLLFLFGFALGIAPIPMVLLGEIFSLETKGLATTISVTLLWVSSSLVAKVFFDLQAFIGKPGTFMMFAAINFISMAFVSAFVPETRGKSFSEIKASHKNLKRGSDIEQTANQ
jgi:hypothetical protein